MRAIKIDVYLDFSDQRIVDSIEFFVDEDASEEDIEMLSQKHERQWTNETVSFITGTELKDWYQSDCETK